MDFNIFETRANNNTNDQKSAFPKETPLAMSYVPFQKWQKLYDDETAFSRGTIFQELDFPFLGEEAIPRGRKS